MSLARRGIVRSRLVCRRRQIGLNGLRMLQMRLQRRERFLRKRHELGVGAGLMLRAELRDGLLMIPNHLAQKRRIEFVAGELLQRFELVLLTSAELARCRDVDLAREPAGLIEGLRVILPQHLAVLADLLRLSACGSELTELDLRYVAADRIRQEVGLISLLGGHWKLAERRAEYQSCD